MALVERIVVTRQTLHGEEQEISSDEQSLTLTLVDRCKTKQLLFNAGGILSLGPFAVSTVCNAY